MVRRNERVKRISGVATTEDCFSPGGSEDEKDKKDFRMPHTIVPCGMGYAAWSKRVHRPVQPWSPRSRKEKIKRILNGIR